MSVKYSFNFASREKRRPLPAKLILVQREDETIVHVALKLIGFLLFCRDRLQVEVNLHLDHIPFVPGLIQLDYTLQPALWVECGDCTAQKLDRLAVKVPQAEIWVMRRSIADADLLLKAMAREELRRDRYGIVALDEALLDEVCSLMRNRNDVTWFRGDFDPPNMQFEFNGLWFDAPFSVLRF